MSEPYQLTQRTILLHLVGWIYGWILVGFLVWTAGSVGMYHAFQADRSIANNRVRLQKALHWTSEFEATRPTARIAEWMMFVYVAAFVCITYTYSISDIEWWMIFVQHTAAMCIALLAASAVILYWIRGWPPGRTWPQACYDLFVRVR